MSKQTSKQNQIVNNFVNIFYQIYLCVNYFYIIFVETKLNNYMKNSQFLCFNDWKKQLIEYKSKIHWIDKNGTNHYLWSKKPTLDNDGNVDYRKLSYTNKVNKINTYRWLCNNKPELLTI